MREIATELEQISRLHSSHTVSTQVIHCKSFRKKTRNVNAAYEHFWNPRWRTSLYGGYAAVSYDSLGQSELCGFNTAPVTNGCDMNWQNWWLGSRTQWNVTKDFYMGVDVLYSKLQTALVANSAGAALAVAPSGAVARAQDVDNWQFRFRVHRDFYP